MLFSAKKAVLLVMLVGALGCVGCATGNPVVDRQVVRRQENLAKTWEIAVNQEERRAGNLADTKALADRELERRIERYRKLATNWMIWAAFI